MNFHKYYNYKLPITTNPSEYGSLLFSRDNLTIVRLTINLMCIIETITLEGKTINKVKLFRNLGFVLEWTDTYGSDFHSFTRNLGHMTYHFENGLLKRKKRG